MTYEQHHPITKNRKVAYGAVMAGLIGFAVAFGAFLIKP